ncbi:helix-turn-helix domain-containing protein [Martelella alba]|uniref:Helix-turn-helix domain-containing protein n=1 Tax=Martelella alba TaxID=2590451 RepID=A0ABY2SHZ9_9HYPH|nr:helix-turn-helix domain-containing protein [Martelella alba]TKI04317.1 helix-turn-helix domain-containing protein [Martelella alba]
MDAIDTVESLELVSLHERAVSFSRLHANSVRYHHWHQCLEILYVEEGYGIVVVNNQQYTMRPGRLFVFPPFKLHKIMVAEGQGEVYRRTIIHLDNIAIINALRGFPRCQARLKRLSQRENRAEVYDISAYHPVIDAIFEKYNTLLNFDGGNVEDIACLLIQLMTFLPEKSENSDLQDSCLSTNVMQWVEDNYSDKFTLDSLAGHLGMSRSYVSRRFRLETGEPIHEYLLTRRIRRACELLRDSGQSIADIAAASGFSDTTYFISSFKKRMGKTPLQYRKTAPSTLAE